MKLSVVKWIWFLSNKSYTQNRNSYLGTIDSDEILGPKSNGRWSPRHDQWGGCRWKRLNGVSRVLCNLFIKYLLKPCGRQHFFDQLLQLCDGLYRNASSISAAVCEKCKLCSDIRLSLIFYLNYVIFKCDQFRILYLLLCIDICRPWHSF